jgi:hypothetical protein
MVFILIPDIQYYSNYINGFAGYFRVRLVSGTGEYFKNEMGMS